LPRNFKKFGTLRLNSEIHILPNWGRTIGLKKGGYLFGGFLPFKAINLGLENSSEKVVRDVTFP